MLGPLAPQIDDPLEQKLCNIELTPYSVSVLNSKSILRSNNSVGVMLWHYRLCSSNFICIEQVSPLLFIIKVQIYFIVIFVHYPNTLAEHTYHSHIQLHIHSLLAIVISRDLLKFPTPLLVVGFSNLLANNVMIR